MKKLIRRIILWAFKDYITGIGLDHHVKSNSWAVLSIHGEKQDYVTFLELNDPDIITLQHFLNQFTAPTMNIDTNPQCNYFLRKYRTFNRKNNQII